MCGFGEALCECATPVTIVGGVPEVDFMQSTGTDVADPRWTIHNKGRLFLLAYLNE